MGLYSIYNENEDLITQESDKEKLNAIHHRYLKDLTSNLKYNYRNFEY
jgi:hypothetical protein